MVKYENFIVIGAVKYEKFIVIGVMKYEKKTSHPQMSTWTKPQCLNEDKK